jgi:hypothetical protein
MKQWLLKQSASPFASKSTWNSRLEANHFFLCQQIHTAWQQPHSSQCQGLELLWLPSSTNVLY